MRMIEARLAEQDARSRGGELAGQIGEAAHDTLARYTAAYASIGIEPGLPERVATESLDALRAWDPEQAAELDGLAEGLDVPLAALMLLQARTEILAHAPVPAAECSTVVALHPGSAPRTMQTWDWHAELAPTGTLLAFETAAGMRVRTFAEAGMLAKIGVNGAGLGLHFNILHHARDAEDAGGVPVHAVARRILAEASTVAEAIALARSAPVSASTVLTTVAHGEAACIELSPAGVAVVAPTDGLLVHTNHFVDPALAAADATLDASTTFVRYDHTVAQASAIARADDAVAMAAAMCGDAGEDAPVCVRPTQALPFEQRWETLLTASLDVTAGAIAWFAGPPSGLTAESVARFA